SAELYCHNDVLNYDNYDYIFNPQAGSTYYCIAFNALNENPCDPEIELVANGGFETPASSNPNHWDYFADGTLGLVWNVEWASSQTEFNGHQRPNPAYLEYQFGYSTWMPFEGSQYAELDTDWDGPGGSLNGEPASVKIYQDLPTVPGREYSINFAYSPRPNTGLNDNLLEFGWNNEVKDVISSSGTDTTHWTPYSYTFTASNSITRLHFKDVGIPNSLGVFLDAVSVRCVDESQPTPTPTVTPTPTITPTPTVTPTPSITPTPTVTPTPTITPTPTVTPTPTPSPCGYAYFTFEDTVNSAEVVSVGLPIQQFNEGMYIPIGGNVADSSIDKTAPGMVMQRGSNWFSAGLYNKNNEYVRNWGKITLVDAYITKVQSMNGFNWVEKAFDGSISTSPDDDELIYTVNGTEVEYYLNIQPYNDAFKVSFACGQPAKPKTTIKAQKIMCDNEADLPNWGAGGPDITSETALNFLAQHPSCHLQPNWKFQWAYENESDPGDNLGDAGAGWNTFGPTNGNGMASVEITDLQNSAKIWVREVWKQGYIEFTGANTNQNESAEMYCHKDVLNYDNHDFVINPQPGETYNCIAFNAPKQKTIVVADKIVCDHESDLPNWGAGGPDINAATAFNFVAQHPNCHFESNWKFQWKFNVVYNPGNQQGEVPGWNTFGPTNSNGRAFAEISNVDGANYLWVREVFKQGYVEFSGMNTNQDESAEMYCDTDVLNYDNVDYITAPQLGKTYYCVAFNALPEPEQEPCGYAQFTFNEVVNSQKITSVGPDAIAFNQGAMIPVGGTVVDNGIDETAPGMAMQRGSNWFTAGLYNKNNEYTRNWGKITLVNAYITKVESLNAFKWVEAPFDGIITTNPNNDELIYEENGNEVRYYLNVQPYSDAFKVYFTCGQAPEKVFAEQKTVQVLNPGLVEKADVQPVVTATPTVKAQVLPTAITSTSTKIVSATKVSNSVLAKVLAK
ncbi:MAG: hypothetical protein V1834_02555, partial [Candidatus Micrarchaeota archaeon]